MDKYSVDTWTLCQAIVSCIGLEKLRVLLEENYPNFCENHRLYNVHPHWNISKEDKTFLVSRVLQDIPQEDFQLLVNKYLPKIANGNNKARDSVHMYNYPEDFN